MIPIQTTTCSFYYSDEFHGYQLDKLVLLTHKELSHKLNWKYIPLKKGSYGYDSMAECIGRLLSERNVTSVEQGAAIVHAAWSYNYKWWVNIKPWVLLDKIYYKPTKSLGDKRRNKLVELPFDKLSEKDKETNLIIAKYLLVDLVGLIKDYNDNINFID